MSINENSFEHSALARARRERAVKFGISSAALEGLSATEKTKRLLGMWAAGEINTDELLRKAKAM